MLVLFDMSKPSVLSRAPNVNEFQDYRAFLMAHFERNKLANPRYTMGAFARALGLGSVSSITKIFHGERHPGPEITEKIVRYFKFCPRGAKRFRDLVYLQKNRRATTLNSLEKKHRILGGSSDVPWTLKTSEFELISKWHHLAIKEMVRLEDFNPNPKWIGLRLREKIKKKEIENAWKILKNLDLITEDKISSERHRYRTKRTVTSEDLPVEAVRLYHESALAVAKRSVRNATVHERELTSTTLCIRHESLPEAKMLIREFREKFVKLIEAVDERPGDSVYQFQMQFFPITKEIKGDFDEK